MRVVVVLGLLALCACQAQPAAGPPGATTGGAAGGYDPGWLAAQQANQQGRDPGRLAAQQANQQVRLPSSIASRDAVMGSEVVRATQAGLPMQPIVSRYAEANIRDGLAPLGLRRVSGETAIALERQRLTDVAFAAITAHNEGSRVIARANDEQRRREAYCRDLAADIGIAGSDSGELLVRMLAGIPSFRETSLYRSCMAGFARTDAYIAR